MASSGNFATMNPLHKTSNSVAYSQGNLKTSPSSSWSSTTWCFSNIVIPKDKKIYVEARLSSAAGVYASLAAATNLSNPGSSEVGGDGSVSLYNESKYVNGTRSASWITAASEGDILQLAIDGSNNKVWLGYNNTWGGSGDPSGGSNEAGTINTSTALGDDIFIACTQNSVSTMTFNFGQDSTFGGEVTAGGNADANGFGDFYYAPPTGFLALSTANLTISADIDPAGDDGADENPTKQFGVVSYTGNSTTGQTITGLGFQPDCIFAKMNSSSQRWFVTDTNRGITKHLFPDANSDEETDSGMGNTNPIYDAFNSDGFELGTSGSGPNDNNRVYTAMCWKGNGGTNSSNSEGSITCSTQANVKGGFSIITYTGTGSSATLGHGLEKAPETVLVKRRSGDQSWAVYHKSLGASQYFTLDSSGGAGSGSGMWNDTAPTSTLITIGSDSRVSLNNQTNVAYAWHGVEGYSKFSSYTGTGSTDGAFCFLGFRPHMIWTKRPGSGDWIIFTYADNSVNTSYVNGAFNPLDLRQKFTTGASDSGKPIDFLSNGFKIRHTDSDTNLSGVEYPYWAWGSVPFKYNNTF